MTPEELQLTLKLQSIFMPFALRRRDAVAQRNGRFVHYTTAESGLNIISSKTLWMRNTTCMSDYSEVQHGGRILQRFFPIRRTGRRTFRHSMDVLTGSLWRR